MNLLTMSLGGALIILVIFLARLLLQNRVHRTVWLLLWFVAVLRLLLPVTVAASTSIFNLPLFETEQTISETADLGTQATRTTAPAQSGQPQSPAGETAAVKPQISLSVLAKILWLAGTLTVTGYVLLSHLRARRSYRFAIPVSRTDVPKGVTVKELEGLCSPLTYGLFRPVILLPRGFSGEAASCPVVAHELSHIRHLDVAYKGLLLVTAAVHWFNPFVWLMVYCASQDMEMRCDADAIRSCGDGRKAYAEILVAAEETKLRGYLQTGFSFSSTAIRLKAIVKDKARPVYSLLTGTVLTVLLLAVFCTGRVMPRAAEPPECTDTTQPAETLSLETSAPTEAPTEILTEAPTEATEPTEAPTEAPAEAPAKAPTECATTPIDSQLTEPTEPTSEVLPVWEPSEELPTAYSIPSPGSITLKCGETQEYRFDSILQVKLTCGSGLDVRCGNYCFDAANRIFCYTVYITAKNEGSYTICYSLPDVGVSGLWATVTVVP